LGVPEHERVEREAERAELVFLAVAVGLAQLAFVAVEDDPGDGVPALVAVEPDVTVYLTKDADAAALRQIAELAPGSTLAMTFLLPTELADDADRAGLQMAENGARAAGTPFISFYTPDETLALAREAGFNAPDTLRSVARRALLRQSDRRSSPVQRRGSPGRDHLTDRVQRSTR